MRETTCLEAEGRRKERDDEGGREGGREGGKEGRREGKDVPAWSQPRTGGSLVASVPTAGTGFALPLPPWPRLPGGPAGDGGREGGREVDIPMQTDSYDCSWPRREGRREGEGEGGREGGKEGGIVFLPARGCVIAWPPSSALFERRNLGR